MLQENTIGSTAKEDVLRNDSIGFHLPGFLQYARYDLALSPETIRKYQDCLKWVVRDLDDMLVGKIGLQHILILKQKIMERGVSDARASSILFALKSFLRYCREVLEMPALDPKKIKPPKRRRRDVIYLTNEEIERFVSAIKVENSYKKRNSGEVRMDGLRFRTLVEVLLGTGMRISEALSLNRDSINFETKEAKIIGKGSKERIVFFSDRALYWVKRYLDSRTDNEQALFLTRKQTRLSRADISKLFNHYRNKAGIQKKLTPHVIRHSVATNLLFNGCPISHVKEILGHDRLETTCKYYLGLDRSKAKEAHTKFLSY